MIGECDCMALDMKIWFGYVLGPIRVWENGLMIPALLVAMECNEFPSYSMWSMEMEVMTERSGVVIILVESLIPPNPTSSTLKSVAFCLKCYRPTKVVISKNDSSTFSLSIIHNIIPTNSLTSSSLIAFPFILILSLKLNRWGLVYKPTL